ncbi:MAG: LCP family protein [Bacillaceae bacterium]|nr:LCP family protein [Bacillaceae bacterium]
MKYTSKREKRKARRRKTLIQTLLFVTLIGIVFWVSSTMWHMYQTYQNIYQPDDASHNASQKGSIGIGSASAKEKESFSPFAVLLLGKDSRPATGSLNTDVIMVAVVNPNSRQVYLLSIPRDTRVTIPGYSGEYKANAVYAYGEMYRRQAVRNDQPITTTGISMAKETFSHLLDIPIDYYVTVDFEGFVAVIDELGGIEVDVDRTLIYDDPTDNTHIFLKKGPQVLSGEEALGYVRHRLDNRGPAYYSSDFDRNRRQRQVLKSALNKFISLEGFTHLHDLMAIAGDHIKTDIRFSTIKDTALRFKDMDADGITTIDNQAYWDSSLGFTIIPEQRLEEIRDILKSAMQNDQ